MGGASVPGEEGNHNINDVNLNNKRFSDDFNQMTPVQDVRMAA